MTASDAQAYRNHLRHEADLPFHCSARTEPESAFAIARRHRRNLAALALDGGGDERRAERADDAANAGELARIEAKLNAVIELFATLAAATVALPGSRPLRFNAHGVEWQGGEVPAPGTPVLIRLHLEASPVLPLELAARVAEPLEAGWSLALFEPLKAPLPDLIGKIVFREHRRQLADSTGNPN